MFLKEYKTNIHNASVNI